MKHLLLSQIVLQAPASATSTLIQLFGPAAAELGVSGVLGYAFGYVLKKIIKVLIAVAVIFEGLQIAFLYWLQSIGAINMTMTVNYANLSNIEANAMTWVLSSASNLLTVISQFGAIIGGFGLGLALGLKQG